MQSLASPPLNDEFPATLAPVRRAQVK